MAIGLNRGRMFIYADDVQPTEGRCGYLHSAQGQQRLVSVSQATKVWARAVDEAEVPVIVITGTLGASLPQTPTLVFARYAELPDPTTQVVGTIAKVTHDPIDSLNGLHVALGADPGQMAEFWAAAS